MVFPPSWTSAAVFKILEKREGRGEKGKEERREGTMEGDGEEEGKQDCSHRSSKVSHKSCRLAAVSPLNPCV